ncbi:MAG: rhomboid family intramembrane serine protease [Bacteroidaceae bacterium]|nr:rhomboid family intramembrane serine protease [Bacteroidaceae bacterium]
MGLIDELKQKFSTGDIVTRLVFINCGVFLVMLMLDIWFTLFSFGEDKFAYIVCNYPWSPFILAKRPWSLVTSLFASWGLFHLIFNMVTLYWLGSIFLKSFTSNNLRGLYILGGVAGMIVFTGLFMLFPSLQIKDWTGNMPLCSACVLAIGSALAFRIPNATEPIPVIGPVKIKYIVIALAIIDVAMLPNVNPTTDAVHLAAALTGWVFNYMLRKGRDITAPVTAVAVWLDKIFTPTLKRK